MRIVTEKEIQNHLEYIQQIRDKAIPFAISYECGLRWLIEEQNKPEPHIAEVVKCGDVNKPKTQIERRNNLIQQLSRRNPTRNLDYILKKVDSIMSDKANIHTYGFFDEVVDFDHAINQHPCSHFPAFQELNDSTGYTCVHCGEWINANSLEKSPEVKTSKNGAMFVYDPKMDCDHVASSQFIAKDGGCMCVKCRQWVNLFDI